MCFTATAVLFCATCLVDSKAIAPDPVVDLSSKSFDIGKGFRPHVGKVVQATGRAIDDVKTDDRILLPSGAALCLTLSDKDKLVWKTLSENKQKVQVHGTLREFTRTLIDDQGRVAQGVGRSYYLQDMTWKVVPND